MMNICSIFPVCMVSNTLEKSTNNSVASRYFCMYSFDVSMDNQNL